MIADMLVPVSCVVFVHAQLFSLFSEAEGTDPCGSSKDRRGLTAKTSMVLPQRPAGSYRKDQLGLTAKTGRVLPQRPAGSYRKDRQGPRRKICQMPEICSFQIISRFSAGYILLRPYMGGKFKKSNNQFNPAEHSVKMRAICRKEGDGGERRRRGGVRHG